MPKLFIKAKKDRKKLLTYLKEDNLASNIITKEEINYDLNFYRLNKNRSLSSEMTAKNKSLLFFVVGSNESHNNESFV